MESSSLRSYYRKLAWIVLFGISMGYFEAAVVVYLRELYYPGALRLIPQRLILVELGRELFSILMILAVAAVSARKAWERFGWFIVIFGTWDIVYYIVLKIALGWPSTLFDWDLLFLIPLPWIGPVIAPVLIAVLMIVFGVMITRRIAFGGAFSASRLSWALAWIATTVLLYSFMDDPGAGLYQKMPKPYEYWMLVIGLILYVLGFVAAWRKDTGTNIGRDG